MNYVDSTVLQEYSESEDEPDVDLENQYYNSKALKEEEPTEALTSFAHVLDLEQEKGEWGFKALKQMMKLHFRLVMTVGQPRLSIKNSNPSFLGSIR